MDNITNILMYGYETQVLQDGKNIKSLLSNNEEMAELQCKALLKEIIDTYLGWTPNEVALYFDDRIITQMHLEFIVEQIIKNYSCKEFKSVYIASKLYPHQIHYNEKQLTLELYQEILDKKIYKFPKGFLVDEKGRERAEICFRYMLERMPPFKSIPDMYNHFQSSAGAKTLKKYRLYIVCKDMYNTPTNYLHQALTPEQRDEFMYEFCEFKTAKLEYQKMKRQQNKF